MFYKLNQAIGIALLVLIIGGAAIYGVVTFLSAPPLLHQNYQDAEGYESPLARSAKKDLQRQLKKLQQQQSDAIQSGIDMGQRATSS